MLGQRPHRPGAGGQIHGTADPGREFRIAGGPIGEIAGRRHLEGAEQGEVDMATADHREGVGMDEHRGAGHQRDIFLRGVDQVLVLLALGRVRAGTEDAVLAMQHDLTVGRG